MSDKEKKSTNKTKKTDFNFVYFPSDKAKTAIGIRLPLDILSVAITMPSDREGLLANYMT